VLPLARAEFGGTPASEKVKKLRKLFRSE
jgi:hypothetical protein